MDATVALVARNDEFVGQAGFEVLKPMDAQRGHTDAVLTQVNR